MKLHRSLAAIPYLCGLALLGFLAWLLWTYAGPIWKVVRAIGSFLMFWSLLLCLLRALWHLGSMWKRKAQS